MDIKKYVRKIKHLSPMSGCAVFIIIFLLASMGETLDVLSGGGAASPEMLASDSDASFGFHASPKVKGIDRTDEYRNESKVGMSPKMIQDQWIYNQTGSMYICGGQYVKDQWLVLKGNAYYMREDGSMANCITRIDDDRYYFDSHGALVKNALVDGTYLTDENGKVLSGYQWIENQQYYFLEDGRMLKSATTPDGVYNINSDGVIISVNMAKSGLSSPLSYAPGTSGYKIGNYPIELYMLSIAGETSGGGVINGDEGRAYGLCQLDYRYDLTDFIDYAYQTHPYLWIGFREIAGQYEAGDERLVSNDAVTNGFSLANQLSKVNYAADQAAFLYERYFVDTYNKMQEAGYHLPGRHIAVSAVLMSININCGPQTDLYLSELSPEMTDEVIIQTLYALRNGILAGDGKGSNIRYRLSEPRLAFDLLSGKVTATSTLHYGGGVSWGESTLSYCGEVILEDKIAARLVSLGNGVTLKLGAGLERTGVIASASDASSLDEEPSKTTAQSDAETTGADTKERGPGITEAVVLPAVS